MKTIIRECKGPNSNVWTGKTRESIIRREWGKRAFFKQDHGLPPGFGQIFIDNGINGNGWSARAATGRVRISER